FAFRGVGRDRRRGNRSHPTIGRRGGGPVLSWAEGVVPPTHRPAVGSGYWQAPPSNHGRDRASPVADGGVFGACSVLLLLRRRRSPPARTGSATARCRSACASS